MQNSWLVYAVAFGMTCLLAWGYQILSAKKAVGVFTKALAIVLMISPLVYISAVRDIAIGIDTHTYVDIFYNIKNNLSFSQLYRAHVEYGYALLNFLVSRMIHNETGILGANAAVIMLFICLACDKNRNKGSFVFGVFIFLMQFFNAGYNLTRQMIAVSIILYAYQYVQKQKLLPYILWVLIAASFHRTALFCLIFWFLHGPKDDKRINPYQEMVFYLAVLLSPILIKPFVTLLYFLLSKIGLYTIYFNNSARNPMTYLLYTLPVLVFLFLYRKMIIRMGKSYVFYYRLMFVQLPIQFVGSYIAFADRMYVYAAVGQVLLIPTVIRNIRNVEERWFVAGCMICWYLFYFWVMIILLGGNGSYPYRFAS